MEIDSQSYKSTLDRDPYQFYANLHWQGKVVWDAGMKAWLVPSYEVCKEIMRADDISFKMPEKLNAERRHKLAEVQGGPRVVTILEGDDHKRMHQWWLRAFSPRRIATWRESVIRPITNRIIDRFIERGTADLSAEFAQLVPIRVIAAVTGLPWEDDSWVGEVKSLNDQVLAIFSSAPTNSEAENANVVSGARAAAEKLDAMLRPFVLRRRSRPGDDLISALWRDGPQLLPEWSELDVLANLRMMIQGGADTTAHAIANACMLLLTQPTLSEEIRSGGESKANTFVEEVLRLHGPVHFRSRSTLADVTIVGCPFLRGDAVIPVVAAANRDPTHYERPEEVNLDRQSPTDHFAFHFGIRMCVGSALARAEILDAVNALLARMVDLKPDASLQPPRFTGWLLRSYCPINVRFTPGVAGQGTSR